jgi:hypothetical protein
MDEVRVRHFFYQLRGISRACLVEATDNNIYVLKMGDTDSNVLFNEAFGSELLRYFGLPVPEWVALTLPDGFPDLHSGLWPDHKQPCVPGVGALHFGSRLIVSDGVAGAYQIIPSKWASRIVNAKDFVGVLALDIWTSHCDSRQAIYSHCGLEESLRATFIDHGHMFGGPNGQKHCRPLASMSPDLHLYRNLPIRQLLSRWEDRIEGLDEEPLQSLLARIPAEWYRPELADTVLSRLKLRKRELRPLFEEACSAINQRLSPFSMPKFVSSIAPRVTTQRCSA